LTAVNNKLHCFNK